MAKHVVKCSICGQPFDANGEEFVKTCKGRRYAHLKCSQDREANISQEEKDKKELEEYIINLLKIDYIDARIGKQIKQYKEEYNFTYSGMRKALIYFYEIKGHSIEKANGGIGIIPYIYRDSYNYYFSLWEAQQRNETKILKEYIPEVEEVVIPIPRVTSYNKKFFTFLEEDEEI